METLRPDALIAGGYKWLLGPYGCGYAYYGPRMDDGVPLEETGSTGPTAMNLADWRSTATIIAQ